MMDPEIKLVPTIKLTGIWIDSNIKKFTFLWFELFWIPMIRIKNIEVLYITVKKNFLNGNSI